MNTIGQVVINGRKYPIIDSNETHDSFVAAVESKLKEYMALDTKGHKTLHGFLWWLKGYEEQ
jgi:hypothetical protein